MNIKVLVVDDSAFMRKVISEILTSASGIEVIATARNGREAVEKTNTLKPDVITMDIDMPEMDGLAALKIIMKECPTPVLMVSAHTQTGAEDTLKSFEYGAIDFIAKPGGSISLNLKDSKDEIITKVKAAAQVDVKKMKKNSKKQTSSKPLILKPRSKFALRKIVTIGSSTGGPSALEEVITKLPGDLPAPVLVVQHMPPDFTKSLAERLNRISAIEVREAKDGDMIQEGLVLIAPGDYHMELKNVKIGTEQIEMVRLNQRPRELGVRPCANIMIKSVASLHGKTSVSVILTGMGNDGTEGLKAIKSAGGQTIVQDKETSLIYGMPKSAVDAGVADYVVPLGRIAQKIVECI